MAKRQTGAPPAPELCPGDGTPRAEDDEACGGRAEDRDWVDGVVARLERSQCCRNRRARGPPRSRPQNGRRRDVLKTSKVTDADRRRAEKLAPAVAAAIVARAAEELRAREADALRTRDSVGRTPPWSCAVR